MTIRITVESDKGRVEYATLALNEPWHCSKGSRGDYKIVDNDADKGLLDNVLRLAQEWGLKL